MDVLLLHGFNTSYRKTRSMKNNIPWTRGDVIGRGSCGTVSLAKNKSNGHAFAVKSVEMCCANRSQLQSLENEITILSGVSSPYIVKYLGDDVSRESSSSYRNMHIEYMSGGTAAGAKQKLDVIRAITICIVKALAYLHSKGIAHCDVKGNNILLGDMPGAAILSDFGSATRLEIGDAPTTILPRGTPNWMAPEVMRGESQGTESDVWSLGCTVVEMVTGNPPWKELGGNAMIQIGFSDKMPEIRSPFSDLGRDFLEKCLRRNPSDRWTCTRLMQHPFLDLRGMDFSKIRSPCSVLRWRSSEFEKDDDGTGVWDEREGAMISARSRIGDLDGRWGPNWGSTIGWETVRRNVVS